MPILESDSEIRALIEQSHTIAVVGMSENPGRDSYQVARYLHEAGYTIFPVNPTVDSILGLKSFPDLDSLGLPVDIVDIFRRPEYVPDIVEAALRTGARSLWMQFGVTNESAAQRASDAGQYVVANRCLMVEHRRLVR